MMYEGYQMKLRSSFYLAHYLICRGGEFGSLIFNPQLGFTSSLHDASLLMHPKTLSSLQIPHHLDAYHHPMVAWPPPKTMIPPLILPHDLIHLDISPPLGYASPP